MFGYVRPQKSELLVREYEQYKGVYCSLCRQLGKSYGVMSRLALSYDCTFYALVLLGLRGDCGGFRQGRCVVNPLKKCTYCNRGEKELVRASALSVIMTYHKIKDDIADSGFFGKLKGYLMLPFAARARKKAARDFPQMDDAVANAMQMQREAERRNSSSLDECAEPTAQMLSSAFLTDTEESPDSPNQRVLNQFGYYLGRWVYLIDAADDIEKDLKSRSFNPFVIRFGLTQASTPEKIAEVKEYANQTLNSTLSQAIAAVNILNFPVFGPIISNVILQGLPGIQKEILFKKEKENVGSL